MQEAQEVTLRDPTYVGFLDIAAIPGGGNGGEVTSGALLGDFEFFVCFFTVICIHVKSKFMREKVIYISMAFVPVSHLHVPGGTSPNPAIG